MHEDDPKRPEEEEEGGPVKSFLEHLEDLRWTIIKVASALLIAMVVCIVGAPQLTYLLTLPKDIANVPVSLELLGPLGGFMISLKLGFYGGLVLGLPFILYFIAEFVIPALKAREKKYFLRAFTIGTCFFLLGIVLCYFFLLPFSLKGLLRYNAWVGLPASIWRAEEYFEFVIKFCLGVGLLCEVPVVILSLVRLGVIKHQFLVKGRRYIFFANFVFCAVLTPTDIVTTFLLAVLLQIGFEICILISRYWEHQRRSAEASAAGRGLDAASSD